MLFVHCGLKNWPACKLNSVTPGGDSHSSWHPVTRMLIATNPAQDEQPYRALFGLAPNGVCTAFNVTTEAVSSYLTFSPLPPFLLSPLEITAAISGTQSWKFFEFLRARKQGGSIFSVALSIGFRLLGVTQHSALWSSDFPLPDIKLSKNFQEHIIFIPESDYPAGQIILSNNH